MFTTYVSDVSALKGLYKVLCALGIFPMVEKSPVRNAQLVVFSVFNVVNLVYVPWEFAKTIGFLNATIKEILAFATNQGILTLLNLICFYGIVTKRKSWKLFFELLDELSRGEYSRDVRVAKKVAVYSVILLITLLIYVCEFILLPSAVQINVYFVMWIFNYIQALSIVLFAIEALEIFKNRYITLNLNITDIFYSKTLNQTQLNSNLQNVKNTIIRLHQNLKLLGEILGKMVFVMFVWTFITILMFFNLFLFISQNEMYYNSVMKGFIMSGLLCSELAIVVVIMIFSCDKVENQGEDLIRTCVYIQAKMGDENAMTLIKLLKELKPKFSAAGFFDVNQKIIPTIFSNLSTYLIIILQFKFSSL
ncbi:unnamed protein product [Phyllotreta striolata]|uniref:Gustatory receptor n=1 Tax=Phyllotreta striolata TaxID=444603 RepID=A0A9N9THM7_PHYSR|nr:unnamed protein product [Phyllotreta striolata]